MSDRDLEALRQHTPEAEPEQEPKVAPLQAAIDREGRQEISDALAGFGFESMAEGIRVVMRTFARSPAVRDAVRDSLHLGAYRETIR